MLVVFDNQHSGTLLLDQLDQLLLVVRIEVVEWLVPDVELGGSQKRPGEFHLLLLAHAHLIDRRGETGSFHPEFPQHVQQLVNGKVVTLGKGSEAAMLVSVLLADQADLGPVGKADGPGDLIDGLAHDGLDEARLAAAVIPGEQDAVMRGNLETEVIKQLAAANR